MCMCIPSKGSSGHYVPFRSLNEWMKLYLISSKAPIINGPVKLLLFTCKIEVSIVLHLTWWNYQLMQQNRVVCLPGPALLFFIFRFEYLISGPKSYQDFREMGPWPNWWLYVLHFIPMIYCPVVAIFSIEPSPPQNVQVYPINGTTMHVKWDPPQYPNGPLELYSVLYSESDSYVGDDLMMMIVTVMPNVTEAFIGGLTPFTNYTIKVKVENTVAFGSSKPLYILTETAGKSDL